MHRRRVAAGSESDRPPGRSPARRALRGRNRPRSGEIRVTCRGASRASRVAWVRDCTFLLLWAWSALAAAPPVVSLPSHEVLRFAVVGDAGDGTALVAHAIARVHAAMPLDAIILPGDNVYPCGVRSADDPK